MFIQELHMELYENKLKMFYTPIVFIRYFFFYQVA